MVSMSGKNQPSCWSSVCCTCWLPPQAQSPVFCCPPNPNHTHPPIAPQSLALVTAKEPLRIAVANNLRTLLTNQLDANTLEQVGRLGEGRQGTLLRALLGMHHILWYAQLFRRQPAGCSTLPSGKDWEWNPCPC